MIAPPAVTFVGELSPHGTDPRLALYCLPAHSAGGRLRRIVGLSRHDYLTLTSRLNLCAGRWDMGDARVHARVIRRERRPVVVLLGRLVVEAFFGHPDDDPPFSVRVDGETRYLVLPHPSGTCREWNAPSARPRALEMLRTAVPGVPWGGDGSS